MFNIAMTLTLNFAQKSLFKFQSESQMKNQKKYKESNLNLAEVLDCLKFIYEFLKNLHNCASLFVALFLFIFKTVT